MLPCGTLPRIPTYQSRLPLLRQPGRPHTSSGAGAARQWNGRARTYRCVQTSKGKNGKTTAHASLRRRCTRHWNGRTRTYRCVQTSKGKNGTYGARIPPPALYAAPKRTYAHSYPTDGMCNEKNRGREQPAPRPKEKRAARIRRARPQTGGPCLPI